MKYNAKVFILASVVTLLLGCQHIRYPVVGASSKYTVRPTNWQGQTCVLTLDADSGKKVYVCGPDRYHRGDQ